MTIDRTRRPGAGSRRSLALTALVVLGLGVALGACEPKQDGGSAAVMLDVRCLDLQSAQDRAQEAGIPRSSSRDATGRDRKQVWDRNWVVVEQTPAAGAPVGDAEVVFSVVKDDEPNTCTAPTTTTAPFTTTPTTTVPTTTAVPTTTTTTTTPAPAPPTTAAPPPPPAQAAPTTARPAPPPPAAAPACANGTYVNVDGETVCSPQSGPTPPPGATAQCKDGTWSSSRNRQGTCSSHGGVARWL
jgi:hypothetical protein